MAGIIPAKTERRPRNFSERANLTKTTWRGLRRHYCWRKYPEKDSGEVSATSNVDTRSDEESFLARVCLSSCLLLQSVEDEDIQRHRSCRRSIRNTGWWELVWATCVEGRFKKAFRVSRKTFNFILTLFGPGFFGSFQTPPPTTTTTTTTTPSQLPGYLSDHNKT